MRIILSVVVSAFLLTGQALAQEQPKAKSDTMSQKEKVSYSLGYKTGNNMRNSSVDIDPEIYSRAFREGYAGYKATMSDQEMANTIGALQMELKAKMGEKKKEMPEKNKQMAQKNKEEGETFLAENAKKEGVVSLPSGLQYKIIKEGTGRQPAKADKVKVHYRGTFINGTEFYDSYKKGGEPGMMGVDKFIKGLTEGLQLMKEGSKWILYIPSALAYGGRGAARGKSTKTAPKTPLIGPNQTLIFEVELISVQSDG